VKLKRTPVPLYYQLERVLRKRIVSGQLACSQPFPTERELCEEFGVSRTTVRQALMALEGDNLIRREQGRGTFVIPRDRGGAPFKLYGTVEDLFLFGAQTTLVLEAKRLIEPKPDIVRDMRLQGGENVYLFEGVRHLYGEHYGFFQAYIPEEIGKDIPLDDLDSPFFIQRVERAALESMKWAHQTISAEAASKRIALKIGVKTGHPLLVAKRIYFTSRKRVLEMAVTSFPGDAYQSVAELERVRV
jgi:GntR family transcriptional regulator